MTSYRVWSVLLIMGLVAWPGVAGLSSMVFDSGPSTLGYIFVGSIFFAGVLGLFSLGFAFQARKTNPQRAVKILRIPFWYGLILMSIFAVASVYTEIVGENDRRLRLQMDTTPVQQQITSQAKIDSTSLKPANFETAPMITGTAQGLDTVVVTINAASGVTFSQESVAVKNGVWSYKVPQAHPLTPGRYQVMVKEFNATVYDQGELVIYALGD